MSPLKTERAVALDDVVAALERVIRERRRSPVAIAADTRLDRLGFDSLDVAEIFLVLEEQVGFRLDTESVTRALVVSDFVGLRPLSDDLPDLPVPQDRD